MITVGEMRPTCGDSLFALRYWVGLVRACRPIARSRTVRATNVSMRPGFGRALTPAPMKYASATAPSTAATRTRGEADAVVESRSPRKVRSSDREDVQSVSDLPQPISLPSPPLRIGDPGHAGGRTGPSQDPAPEHGWRTITRGDDPPAVKPLFHQGFSLDACVGNSWSMERRTADGAGDRQQGQHAVRRARRRRGHTSPRRAVPSSSPYRIDNAGGVSGPVLWSHAAARPRPETSPPSRDRVRRHAPDTVRARGARHRHLEQPPLDHVPHRRRGSAVDRLFGGCGL